VSHPEPVLAGRPPGAPRWRVVVIDDHAPSRATVEAAVAAAGGIVIERATTGASGLALVERRRPDAVVLAVGLPDDDGVAVAAEIMRRAPCAIVLLTSHASTDLARRARAAGAMAYLPKPLRAAALEPAIELAIARFAELTDARRALADRKLIERAKGLLMQRLGLAEPAAFRLLQKTAMDRRVSMASLADALVNGKEVIVGSRPSRDRTS
jgi:response regulator NasT